MVQPMSILDLVAMIPFYLEILFASDHPSNYRGAMSIRAFRLLRILSFLRIERSYNAIKKLRKIFRKKRSELFIVTYITAVLLLISSTTIYFLEHQAQPEVFDSVFVGAWWSVVTITSLGYGDTIPITAAGRVFGSLVALCGIILFSIPGAVLGSGFIEVMLEHQQQRDLSDRERILTTIASQRSRESKVTSKKSFPPSLKAEFKENSFTPSSYQISQESCQSSSNIENKLESLVKNQEILEVQLELQRRQLETIIELLQHRFSSLDSPIRRNSSSSDNGGNAQHYGSIRRI